jgi:hypothetical protein
VRYRKRFGSKSNDKELEVFVIQKIFYYALRTLLGGSEIRDLEKLICDPESGSRGQKSTRSQIRIRNTAFWTSSEDFQAPEGPSEEILSLLENTIPAFLTF